MKSTYQMMKALITLPPIGKAVKDGSSNTRISGGEVRVKICAVDPGWPQFTFRDFLPEPIVLSDFSRGGYSDKPWVAGQEIMVPDGYLIIAMLVDDNGKSLKDELLPISLEELPNNDWALNKSAPFRTSDDGLAFGGFPGQIIYSASVCGDVNFARKTSLTNEMREDIISAVRESDLFTSLQAAIADQAASTVNLQQAVNDAVGDAIRNSLAPGGPIWNSLNR